MSYENAPATKLLATHCCICNRPLVDADSVENGIGPDCREKYGYSVDVPEAARAEANVIVHRIALDRKAATVKDDVLRLRALGLNVLADTLMERLMKPTVKISEKDGMFILQTPYSPAYVAAIKGVPGRRWDPTSKAWSVPATSKAAAYGVLVAHYAGQVAKGPKGLFVIGAPVEAPLPTLPLPAVEATPVSAEVQMLMANGATREEAEAFTNMAEEPPHVAPPRLPALPAVSNFTGSVPSRAAAYRMRRSY